MTKILLITEGQKPDKELIEKIFRHYSSSNKNIEIISYDTNIYRLYEEIKKEFPDDLDEISIITILNQKIKKERIERDLLKKDEISEIYLFFDYDIQHYKFSEKLGVELLNSQIQEMLEYFNNESNDIGKLYINYPMVESFFKDNLGVVDIDTLTSYKSNKEINRNKGQFTQNSEKFLDKNLHSIFIKHLEKEIYIILEKEEMLDYLEYMKISSEKILEKQIEKYVINNMVHELSTVPKFIIDYFGEKQYKKFLK